MRTTVRWDERNEPHQLCFDSLLVGLAALVPPYFWDCPETVEQGLH